MSESRLLKILMLQLVTASRYTARCVWDKWLQIRVEKMYCDVSGKIFIFLNRFRQVSLQLQPTIILITLFYIMKNLQL
jgi:hypothetical protein